MRRASARIARHAEGGPRPATNARRRGRARRRATPPCGAARRRWPAAARPVPAGARGGGGGPGRNDRRGATREPIGRSATSRFAARASDERRRDGDPRPRDALERRVPDLEPGREPDGARHRLPREPGLRRGAGGIEQRRSPQPALAVGARERHRERRPAAARRRRTRRRSPPRPDRPGATSKRTRERGRDRDGGKRQEQEGTRKSKAENGPVAEPQPGRHAAQQRESEDDGAGTPRAPRTCPPGTRPSTAASRRGSRRPRAPDRAARIPRRDRSRRA